MASGMPSVESWSVSARISTPRDTARSTRALGVSMPSEWLLWVWKSARLLTLRHFSVYPADATGQARGLIDVD